MLHMFTVFYRKRVRLLCVPNTFLAVCMTIPDCQWTCFNQCIIVFSCFPTTYLHIVNLLLPLSLHFSSGSSNNPLPAPIISLSTNGDSLDNISIVLPFSIPEVTLSSLKLKLYFNNSLNISLDQSNFTISDNIITVNLTGMDSLNPGAYEVTYSLSFFGETPPEMSSPKTFDRKLANNLYICVCVLMSVYISFNCYIESYEIVIL